MSEITTIFSAKKIYTMDVQRKTATHVAVQGDRIVGVGDFKSLSQHGSYELDTRFEDKILLPGFIEGHSHILEGHLWRYVYLGFYDRVDPDGKLWPGLKSIEAIIERLNACKIEGDAPIIGWGFDPIYFSGRRMIKSDLDKVSTTRPVFVLHASGHCLNTNSLILDRAGITELTDVEGVVKCGDNRPTGELREMAAMFAAFEVTETYIFNEMGSEQDLWNFAKIARSAGVTTATELYSPVDDHVLKSMQSTVNDPEFPLRLVVAKAASANVGDDIRRVEELQNLNTDKLHFGPIKVMTDGSIQGFTARLKSPQYYNGAPNGIWNATPEEIDRTIFEAHKAGVQLHIHTNGDEAIELAITSIKKALSEHPWAEHGHVLQHCQLITKDMLVQCERLGICTNIFANHIYYWGDQHAAYTIGPERAQTLDPVGSALDSGVNFAMHSDAPITPLAPLFTAWCAVNRITASGVVLGASERINVHEALYAITMGAARSLKLSEDIGSLEPGKFADFAVLDADPYDLPPENLKDVPVHGVVLGGQSFVRGAL